MKLLAIIVLFSLGTQAHAFTSCKNKKATFAVSIYEETPVRVLVLDKKASVAPASYLCEKRTMVNDGDQMAAYGCVGGYMGAEDRKVAIYVNETDGLAEYQDLQDEDNDKSNIECEITK
jgi:hypothetical protein